MPSFGLGADRVRANSIVKSPLAREPTGAEYSLADLTLAGAPSLSTRRRAKRHIGKIEYAS
jgi:hypothetical protein